MRGRGRAPKPTQVQIAKGDPGGRAKKKAKTEPVYKANAVRCPAWLSVDAQKEWKRVVEEMKEYPGLMTNVDVGPLATYCKAYGDMVEADREVKKEGKVRRLLDKEGNVKYLQQNPWVSIGNKAALLVARMSEQFGFTPASRTRVAVGKPEKPGGAEADKALGWEEGA